MFSVQLPARLLQERPGSYRQVIAPPDGDLMNSEIAPIDTVIDPDTELGPAIRMGFKLEQSDLDYLLSNPDAVVMLTLHSPAMPPISVQVY